MPLKPGAWYHVMTEWALLDRGKRDSAKASHYTELNFIWFLTHFLLFEIYSDLESATHILYPLLPRFIHRL
jgi:hypothetical protein